MNLSEAQVRDILELRQLHIARREQLVAERRALTRQMTEPMDEAWRVRENISKTAVLSESLREIAAQDYQIDAEVQCAALRGVNLATWGYIARCCGMCMHQSCNTAAEVLRLHWAASLGTAVGMHGQ